MRLRRFIFLSVAAVVITLTLLFSIITRHQWVDFSKKLVKDRKNFIAHLVEANIHAKENLLKESANLIQRNGELASSFLLTEEIKDSHILSEEINKLRKNNPSINVAVKPLNSSNKKITWENHGNKISIVHFSTLYHFNRPVADLQLTTPLLDDSLSQIMDMTSSKINFESKNGNLFPYFLSQFPGLYFQIVLADNSMVSMAENLTTTLLLTGIVSLILMGIILYISLSRKLIYPLHRMTDHLVNQSERLKHGLMPILSDFSESAFQEIKQIQKTTDQFSISLNSFRDIIEDKSKKAALVEMAQQVAHDIRSPLSALKIASQLIENNLKINESNDLMKKSILRINDIANDLLSKKQTLENNHDEQRIVADPIRTKETFMLSSMVDIIISEKRMQYIKNEDLFFRWSIDANTFGLFALVDHIEVKRMLSNLINNSVEAMNGDGEVKIELKRERNYTLLSISDTGSGIPEKIIRKVTDRGFSYNKDKGTGLGLYHAQQLMSHLNGHLEIASTVGKGTTINLYFPQVDPPKWFDENVEIKNKNIIIVDDESHWHELWLSKLKQINFPIHKVTFFSHLNDFEEYVRIHLPTDTLYFIDYNFLETNKNGLDAIEDLKIQRSSILVTSDFDSQVIKERLDRNNLKLIPKTHFEYFKLRITG